MGWYKRWRLQRYCFHHDKGGNPANTWPAFSWIQEQIIDAGRAKMYWCTNCKKTWII